MDDLLDAECKPMVDDNAIEYLGAPKECIPSALSLCLPTEAVVKRVWDELYFGC